MTPLKTMKQVWIAFILLLWSTPALWAQVQIQTPVSSTLSVRDRIAVIATGWSNLPMALRVNGIVVKTQTVRPDMKAEFLNVPVPQGPVNLQIEQTSPTGEREMDQVNVHVLGPVARLRVHISNQHIPADSLSNAHMRVQVLDAWGLPLPNGQIVTAHIDKGHIQSQDIYPNQPGTQVQTDNGYATFTLSSSGQVGEAHIAISSGSIQQEVRVEFTTPKEKWFLVGTATGQIGWRKSDAPPLGATLDKQFDEGLYGEGRVAFFTRGTLKENYLFSASFDSDRRYEDRVFTFLTPETLFSIRGDASSIFYQTPSASRLFARISRNQSFVQYGDFATGWTRLSELSAYNRTFTGISSELRSNHIGLSLFGASTDQAIQIDELPGEGVSGYYYLTAAQLGVPLVEGSETIVLQTRDRLHPERIIHEDYQYRFTDYDIDYESGTLLFKRAVSAFDPNENPIFIVATYETAQSLQTHLTGGGRLTFTPNKTFDVGTTLVAEERATDTYWLTGLDARYHPSNALTLHSEIARTNHIQTDWAWKIGSRGQIYQALNYDISYRDIGQNFENPSSPTARPGLKKWHGKMKWKPLPTTHFQAEAFRTDNQINNDLRSSASAGASHQWGALTQQVSVEKTQSKRPGRNIESTIVNVGAELAITSRLSIGANRDQVFGDEDFSYRPTLTHLTTRWELDKRVDILAEHAFRDGGFIDSSFTSVGLQSRMTDNFTAYANYKLDGGIHGKQNQAIVGLRHKYRPRNDLTLHLSFERVWALRGTGNEGFYAYSLAGEYLPKGGPKASGRIEQRNGNTLDKVVVTSATDIALGNRFSLLGKYEFLDESRSHTGPQTTLRTHNFQTGLAYRPVFSDAIHALGKYEFKHERNNLTQTSSVRTVHMGSFETLIEPRAHVEWFIRYGFKQTRLTTHAISTRALTDLWMTSLRVEWHRAWDILGEYRLLTQHLSKDYEHGAAFELGHIPANNTRIAIGYNIAGHQDDDFAGTSYWAKGPYLKMQIKFTETTIAAWLGGLRNTSK